jgi:hypothetical protein
VQTGLTSIHLHAERWFVKTLLENRLAVVVVSENFFNEKQYFLVARQASA